MTFVLWLVVLLGVITSCVRGQGLPFQVNSRQTCATQTSIDTRTLTGVKRGDENAPCSGYLMYTDGSSTRRLCSDGSYGFSDFAAERACYTLGVNFYRDSTVFDSSRTRQMKLYQCFNYKEQGVDSIETDQNELVFDASYIINDWIETVCLDAQANPDAYDCFDTCYFTSPDYGTPHASTEAHCGDHQPFFTLGCADHNECETGVRDYCTGPYESSCTIRTACGNNTDCTNHPGSFECSCKNGYEYRSGKSFDPYDLDEGCKDVDECAASRCNVNARCVNTIGSYLCWCRDGFIGDGKTCTLITCNDLPKLPNAEYKLPSTDSYGFGDTIVYECDEGHKVSVQNLVNYFGYTTDSFTLTCGEMGAWGPYPVPQCISMTCNYLPKLPNAKYKLPSAGFSSYGFGDAVVYECDEGYQVSVQNLPENLVNYYGYTTTDSFTLTCGDKGAWGPYPVPQCMPVDCGDPGLPLRAGRHETGFTYNQEVVYTCEDGYKSQQYGSVTFTRRCQADGTWTASTSCVDVDECEVPDICTEEQHCINTKGSFLCLDGLPDNCDVPGFCKNGDCRMRNGGAECVCDAGYVGLQCETPSISTALILAIVALVILGVFIIMFLVSRLLPWSLSSRNQPASSPQAAISPRFVNRGSFPTKDGFGRPVVRW